MRKILQRPVCAWLAIALFVALLLPYAVGAADGQRSPPAAAQIAEAKGNPRSANPAARQAPDRAPVDLALTPDERLAVTANQSSGSASLIRIADGVVLDEASAGQRPGAVAITPDGKRALVTAANSGELIVFSLANDKLALAGAVSLGFEPRGVAISPDGKKAFVALSAAAAVAVVDLEKMEVASRIEVGRWPRYLALSPDGKRLAVGVSGDGGIAVVDTVAGKLDFRSSFVALNLGHMQVSADGKSVYMPWMYYGDRPISSGNIQMGWVLANRVARVRIDHEQRREAAALDPRGKGFPDPHGLALSADETWLALSAAGSGELAVGRIDAMSLREDGPGDHMDPALAMNDKEYYRIPLGGRPLGIRMTRDGRRVLVANALVNAVQVVDLGERRVSRTISLGGPSEPSLARRGEAIFYDAKRSIDQWYSCHSCHYEGGTNALTMDTMNDGSTGTYKMVLSLQNVTRTGPWFWHGWQASLPVAVRKSMRETMQGPPPSDADVEAVIAFFDTLTPPPNSRRPRPNELSAEAARGKKIFEGGAAACSNCHSGPLFMDGQNHDVGLGTRYDAYRDFNTPSLLGTHNRVGYLHHGRAKSLEDLLTDLHSPQRVSGTRDLTAAELADLVAYLRSL